MLSLTTIALTAQLAASGSVTAHVAPPGTEYDRTTGLPTNNGVRQPPPPPPPTSAPTIVPPSKTPTTTGPRAPIQRPTGPTPRPRRPPSGDLPPADAPPIDSGELPAFNYDSKAPFPTEQFELSQVLKESLEHNLDLRANAYDVGINEANILAALGAYDVIIRAGVSASLIKQPQRGSAFVFSTGSSSLSGNFGFNRKLETGGNIDLSIVFTRGVQNQPVSFFNAALGTIDLAQYTIAPTLTLSHPLLKGAGVKVNRADIDKAKLAKSQTEALQMVTAQNTVRDILNAYWEVLYAHRDIESKRRAIELTGEQLERTRAEVNAGRRSPIELRSIEQTMAQRENDLLLAENTLLDRSITVRTLMGQDLAKLDTIGITPLTDPAEIRPRPIDQKLEIQRAMEANPQVRQLQLAIASRRIDEMVAANQRLPQLDVQGTFSPQGRSVDRVPDANSSDPGEKGSWGQAFRNFFTDDPIADGALMADYTLSGSLNLTWDVQNRGAKGAHQRTLLELRKAEESLSSSRYTIAASVIRATNTIRNSAKRMEVTAQAVDLAVENLEAEKARYGVGRSTAYDVLFRMDELQIAEANALRAQIDYLQAMTELQVLNGELLPAYGLEIVARPPPISRAR